MTLTNLHKTPFPYFGGKSAAADIAWEAMGDVEHYVEPFAGSLAVLLRRPHEANRTYYSETVNDADGLLVNAWRSMQLSPDETARHASNPVAEADLHARHYALVKWRAETQLEQLMGDPSWHDPQMAGWWMWGMSSWIGSGFCSGNGAWSPDETGRLRKSEKRSGVKRQRPHLGNNGQGVNHAGTREPGVDRNRPHLGDDGQGVNRPQLREPGVESVAEFHPVTMPELLRWFRFLSARLRHVRIINGDWSRVLTGGASKPLAVRMGGGACGVFLDPPYSTEADRDMSLYAKESGTVAHDVRAWCAEHGDDPQYRIVLAGFDNEHTDLEPLGWRCVEWFKAGFLTGGMGNAASGGTKTQQKRERMWLSPHCLGAEKPSAQGDLFGLGAA